MSRFGDDQAIREELLKSGVPCTEPGCEVIIQAVPDRNEQITLVGGLTQHMWTVHHKA